MATDSPNTTDPERIEVDENRIACDGGGGALGHPKVYLEMGKEKSATCGYCGRLFILKAGTSSAAKH